MSDGAPGSGGQWWDVVIVGAGPVGLLLAGQLAERQVRVVVLESTDAPATLAKANGIVGRTAVDLHRRKILTGSGLRVLRPPRFQFGPLVLRLGMGRSAWATRCTSCRSSSGGWRNCSRLGPSGWAPTYDAVARSPALRRMTMG